MKLSKQAFKKFSAIGKERIIKKSMIIDCGALILLNGLFLVFYSGKVIKPYSAIFVMLMLFTWFLVFKYITKKNGSITNGYNFLMLSLFGIINSVISMSTSCFMYYNRFHNKMDILIMLAFYGMTVAAFYLLVIYKINAFNQSRRKTEKKSSIGKSPYVTALMISVLFMIIRILQNVEKDKKVILLSVGLYFMAILYMILSFPIIKFIYLKSENLI